MVKKCTYQDRELLFWTLLNNYDLEDVRGAGLQIEELIMVDNLCAMFDSNVCKVWKESILNFQISLSNWNHIILDWTILSFQKESWNVQAYDKTMRIRRDFSNFWRVHLNNKPWVSLYIFHKSVIFSNYEVLLLLMLMLLSVLLVMLGSNNTIVSFFSALCCSIIRWRFICIDLAMQFLTLIIAFTIQEVSQSQFTTTATTTTLHDFLCSRMIKICNSR